MNKHLFDDVYQQLTTWFHSFEQHEVTNVVTIVERAKQYLSAAEDLPDHSIKQFVDNLSYDLQQFYQAYQTDAKHSIFLGILEEEFWQTLGQITDKSQVEWAELGEDFQHQGYYHKGDMIGFGVLLCDHCHESLSIYHLSEVPECPQCGHGKFSRQPLTP